MGEAEEFVYKRQWCVNRSYPTYQSIYCDTLDDAPDQLRAWLQDDEYLGGSASIMRMDKFDRRLV